MLDPIAANSLRRHPAKIMLRLSLALAAAVCLSACGKWHQQSAYTSPDGRVSAVVEYKGSAACCSDHSRLRLVNASNGMLTDPSVAVEVTRASIKPHWVSDDLLIVEACGATNISAQSRLLREPVVNEDGSMNAVRVEVVTSPLVLVSGASFCASAEG